MSNLKPQAKHIPKYGEEGAKNPEDVEPSGSVNRIPFLAIVQSDLQQKSGQSNRRKHNYSQRTMECTRLGIHHDQSQ